MVTLFQKTYDRMFDRVMNLLRKDDVAEVWSFDDRKTRLEMEAEAKSRGITLRARSAYKPLVNAFLEEVDLSDVTAVSVSFFLTETQLPARRPTTTAEGHSGVVDEMVCTSPLGSL